MATIGEQIREARKAKGMTQSALAALVNMSRQGVSHWEQGRTLPDAQILLRLSRILGYNFEANQPEDEFAQEQPPHFSLAVHQSREFPFVPDQVITLLHRASSADAGEPAPENAAQPISADDAQPLVEVQFRTNDRSIKGVECILIGQDQGGSGLQYRTHADLVLEADEPQQLPPRSRRRR